MNHIQRGTDSVTQLADAFEASLGHGLRPGGWKINENGMFNMWKKTEPHEWILMFFHSDFYLTHTAYP